MKNKDQKSFVIYTEYRELIELLTIADRGRLFTAMMEYCTTGEVSIKLSGTALAVFISIRQSLDRDAEKYKKRCEMNREHGKRGGRPRKAESDASYCDGGDFDGGEAMNYCDRDTGEVIDYSATLADEAEDNCAATTDDDDENAAASEEQTRRPEDILEENFARFWEAYPKKLHRSDARLTWINMKPNTALTNRMLDAIEIQKYSKKWCAEDGRYIPSANRWLLSAGWTNELDPADLRQAESTYKNAQAFAIATKRSMS